MQFCSSHISAQAHLSTPLPPYPLVTYWYAVWSLVIRQLMHDAVTVEVCCLKSARTNGTRRGQRGERKEKMKKKKENWSEYQRTNSNVLLVGLDFSLVTDFQKSAFVEPSLYSSLQTRYKISHPYITNQKTVYEVHGTRHSPYLIWFLTP